MGEVKKNFSIALDIKQSTSNRAFEVVEGDNGNVLAITLTDNGAPVALTDCRVLAVFSKSDGSVAVQDNDAGGITIDPAQANQLYIALYTGSFAPGLVECELQVYSGEAYDVLITSARFNFMCRRGIANDNTIASTNEWPILVGLIDHVLQLQDMDGAREAAEHARAYAEHSRAAAEEERQECEAAREAALNKWRNARAYAMRVDCLQEASVELRETSSAWCSHSKFRRGCPAMSQAMAMACLQTTASSASSRTCPCLPARAACSLQSPRPRRSRCLAARSRR